MDNGDNYLSGNKLHIWSIVHDILLNYHVLIIFNHTRIDVPRRIAEHIEFFIPKDCSFKYEILKMLEAESKELRRDPVDERDIHWPGTRVDIHEYSGLNWHLHAEVRKKIASEASKNFLMKINALQRKSKRDQPKDEGEKA